MDWTTVLNRWVYRRLATTPDVSTHIILQGILDDVRGATSTEAIIALTTPRTGTPWETKLRLAAAHIVAVAAEATD